MRLLALGVLLAATGCASTLSTMQTARPLARGQYQVSGGMGFYIPAGQLATVADQGIAQSRAARDAIARDEFYALSEEDQQALLTAGISLSVAPPGVNNELMVRTGVLDGLVVGLRLSTTSTRLDAKYRFLHRGDPEDTATHLRNSYDMAIGLGLSRHSFKSKVLDLLEVVQIDDFSRYDVEVPLYMSADFGDIFKLYAAPKYIFSRTWLDQKLVDYSQQGKDVSGFDVRLPARVNSHFTGATVGLGLGYKYVHLFAELTAGYTFSRPMLFGQQRELGGVTLYPAIGLAFKTGAPAPQAAAPVPAPASAPLRAGG